MKYGPDSAQKKITCSLVASLILVIAVCYSGIGDRFHDSGLLMRLFLLFAGAVVVGLIFALQVIPGLVSLGSIARGMRRLLRRDEGSSGGNGTPGG